MLPQPAIEDNALAILRAAMPEPEPDILPAFPEIAWRRVVAEYRDALRWSTEASDVAHFASFWAACAVSLGRRVRIFSGDWVYPNVYLSIFGETGDKKTSAQRLPRSLGIVPESVKIISGHGSSEGLADKLKTEGDSIALIAWEELSGFYARNTWKGSTLGEFVVEAFDCPPVLQFNYRKDPVTLCNPTVSILSGTTPAYFWRVARPDDFYGGLGNRFVYLTGTRKSPIANPVPPCERAIARVREAVDGLTSIPPCTAFWEDPASALYERFYIKWENRQHAPLVAAAVKRIPVYVRKLAIVYAALERTLPRITSDQLRAAIAVGMYASACAKRLIEQRIEQTRPEGELEIRLLEYVKHNNGITRRRLQQITSRWMGSAKRFNETMASLLKADLIKL